MSNKRIKNRLIILVSALALTSMMAVPINAQASVWQDIKDGTVQGWEKTKEVFGNLITSTKEAVNAEENKQSIKEGAKEAWSGVKGGSSRAWEATKEGAGAVSDKVVKTSKEGYEKAKELAE